METISQKSLDLKTVFSSHRIQIVFSIFPVNKPMIMKLVEMAVYTKNIKIHEFDEAFMSHKF